MASAYNPDNSGGRDQEDPRFKASPGQIVHETYLEKTHHKKSSLVEWFKL
jgi:hypothetical protein